MNIINGELELWIYTGNENNFNRTIIAVSNRGRIKTKDGNIRYSKYREMVTYKGIQIKIYRFLADNFILKTEEDLEVGRNVIDHITHKPEGMNINDVRNLRWCTGAENAGFPEARANVKEGLKKYREEHPGFSPAKGNKRPDVSERNRKYNESRRGVPTCEFSRKYKEHFGALECGSKRYKKEWNFHKKYGKCSWE